MKKQNKKSNRISVEDILKEWGSDKKLSRIIPTHYYKKYKIRKIQTQSKNILENYYVNLNLHNIF